jgi:hypothetical protein
MFASKQSDAWPKPQSMTSARKAGVVASSSTARQIAIYVCALTVPQNHPALLWAKRKDV